MKRSQIPPALEVLCVVVLMLGLSLFGSVSAAGVDGGVWKTTNGGASWRAVSDALPNIAVGSLAMDPTNRNVIYAGTGEAFAGGMGVTGGGIFKTTDAGITWTRLPGTTTSDFFIVPRLVISPNNPARLY